MTSPPDAAATRRGMRRFWGRHDVGMPVTRVEGAGTQLCLVRADRSAP